MSKNPKSILIVTVQVVSFLFLLFTGPLLAKNSLYLILELIGILLGIWALLEFRHTTFQATPEIGRGANLIVAGPYKYIRHPMYTSLLLIAASLLFDSFSVTRLIVFLILFVDLLVKIQIEEKFLTEHFQNYEEYKKRTQRLIPFIY